MNAEIPVIAGVSLSLMLVELSGTRFAVPLERVVGVTETAKVTPLPFSPPGLEGVVMALGQIVPQVATGRAVGLAQGEGGVLLVVSDTDGSLALRIDRVIGLIQCDPASLTAEGADGTPLGTHRIIHDGHPVPVLDVTRLALDTTVALAPGGQALLATEAAGAADAEPVPDKTIQSYMRVEIAGDPYALPLDAIGDLMVLPDIRRMPDAPAWVTGLFDYRGQPFLALDTARLLGSAGGEAGSVGIVVPYGGRQVALLVTRAAGVERIADEALHPMALPMAGIESYHVDPAGGIVGIISVAALLGQIAGTLTEIAPRPTPVEAVAAVADEAPARRILTVQAGGQVFGLPLERVKRIEASVTLSPLPFDGGGFHGMADVGDAVVPVLDLRRCLGAAPETAGVCALTMLDGAIAGLMVDQVVRIEDLPDAAFMPVVDAPLLPVTQIAMIGGRAVPMLAIDRLLPPLP